MAAARAAPSAMPSGSDERGVGGRAGRWRRRAGSVAAVADDGHASLGRAMVSRTMHLPRGTGSRVARASSREPSHDRASRRPPLASCRSRTQAGRSSGVGPGAGPRTRDVPSGGPVVDLGIDRRRQSLAAHAGQEVGRRHRRHPAARHPGRGRDVGHDQAVVQADQRVIRGEGLRIGDVEGRGPDRARRAGRRRGRPCPRPVRAPCSRGSPTAASSRGPAASIRWRVSAPRLTWSETKSAAARRSAQRHARSRRSRARRRPRRRFRA